MKTLILTLPPHIKGGVASKAKILADFLKKQGHHVTLGVYAARSEFPGLNVGIEGKFKAQKLKTREISGFGGHRCVVVGCAFPEMEYNYTAYSAGWSELISSHDRHIAVGGTVAIAHPLVAARVKHLVWCASDILGDRSDRQAQMNFVRRAVDKIWIEPRLLGQQRAVLASDLNRIMGVSPYSISALQNAYQRTPSSISVLPIPTDFDFFSPSAQEPANSEPWVLGFAGRLDDPRKNAELLFQTVARLVESGKKVELRVTGNITDRLQRLIDFYNIANHVKFLGHLDSLGLRSFYQSLSLFIIPSHQEGLGIVGIEALACGVPLVSTKCGGPEAYIRPGENGLFCDFEPADMVSKVDKILGRRDSYLQFAQAARDSVISTYSNAFFQQRLDQVWNSLWHEKLLTSR